VNTLKTDATSEQTQINILRKMLKPRVILVNHEKRLSVDTTCANLGIKYNMLYISVYQLIKQHIEENTSFGKALLATKKPRAMLVQT
jgi:DNA polymerase III gamma/tau subunit